MTTAFGIALWSTTTASYGELLFAVSCKGCCGSETSPSPKLCLSHFPLSLGSNYSRVGEGVGLFLKSAKGSNVFSDSYVIPNLDVSCKLKSSDFLLDYRTIEVSM
jgi:hypothetical protein